MASCVSCGKTPLRKNTMGVFNCPRCGPRPFKIAGRLVMPAELLRQQEAQAK